VLTSVLHVRRAAWFDSARVVADEFELVSSLKLLDKLAEVLARPKLERWVSQAGAHEYLDALAESATMIEDPPDPPRLAQLALTYLAWRGAPGKSEKPAHLPRRCTGGHQAARPAIQFITIQVYAGVPLTTIAKQCGTSDTMIEKHYADVIENWDGVQQPAEVQIRAARQARGRSMDFWRIRSGGELVRIPCKTT
jgi:hypothetical protein